MDYLKLAAEIYLRQIGIDAEVTTVPKKKINKVNNTETEKYTVDILEYQNDSSDNNI